MTERPTLNGGSGWALNPECFHLTLPCLTLILVVLMRHVRKSRTHIILMFYFELKADKPFLMTLVKFRNKN